MRWNCIPGAAGSTCRSKTVVFTAFCSSAVSRARLSVSVSAIRKSTSHLALRSRPDLQTNEDDQAQHQWVSIGDPQQLVNQVKDRHLSAESKLDFTLLPAGAPNTWGAVLGNPG